MFYLPIFPPFFHSESGHFFLQSLVLGLTQMTIRFTVNFFIVMSAGSIAAFFAPRPPWSRMQPGIMGGVLASLTVKLAMEDRE